ncbi:MAG: radical SAM family heme chaperone HemW [Bacteroidales bacterium]|nr:radical SAM family heme chaperone HemW [Bacteroidales bacterium]
MNFPGLYIHIPFCKSKCFYCDFFSVSQWNRKKELLEALMLEIKTESSFLGVARPALRTIYFGGGTPSMLDKEDFENLFFTIEAHYDISHCEEITLEANPDDLSPDYIRMLRGLPFNRISIGVQSFQDNELRAINRRHSAMQASEAIKNCRKLGFDNISLDLMYGLPGQTMESFEASIEVAVKLPVTHISSYALSWEEGSVLFEKREQGLLVQTEDEILETCYFKLIERLKAAKFVQYELSNFALPGFESRHNSSYWKGTPYLGVGPGAHSYSGSVRRMNVRSIEKYIHGIEEGMPCREAENLDADTRYNDMIITRLRTLEGLSLSELGHLFGQEKLDYCLKNAAKSIGNGFLAIKDDRLRLQKKGFFIADTIFSDLLWVED